MKNMLAILIAVILTASFVDAQVIKPRGAAPATPAVTTPAPATTAPAVTPETVPTPTPAPTAPAVTTETPATDETEAPAVTMDDLYRITENIYTATFAAKSAAEQTARRRHYGDDAIFSPDILGRRNERLHEKVNMLVYSMIVLVLFNMLVYGAIMIKPLRRRLGISLTVLALGLGLASQVQAQTPTPAAKPTPACSIRAITTGAVIVKEQDPAAIAFAVRNCGEVKSVLVATGATDITFTDVVSTPTKVTAKVAAKATALTGPTSFKLIRADGTETMSPDAVYLLVLDTQTAQVRKDAAAATTAVTKEVTTVRKEIVVLRNDTVKAVAELGTKLNAVANSRPTTNEVEATLAPMRQRVADLEKVTTALMERATETDRQMAILARATYDLAEGQAHLGNTVVKKGGFLGFGGKKPLDTEVASAAERIKAVLVGKQ